jgi:hypothetical protein
MNEDGTCPGCGRVLETVQPQRLSGKQIKELAGEDATAPWHFKLLVVLVIVYLVYRTLALVGVF